MMRTAKMMYDDADEIWKSTGDMPSALSQINKVGYDYCSARGTRRRQRDVNRPGIPRQQNTFVRSCRRIIRI